MAVDPQRVRTVFLAAAKHQELADRAVVLDTECAGDLELRRRVEVLLNDYDRSDGTIHSPAAGSRPDAPPAVDTGISGLGLTVIFSGEGVTSKPTNRAVPAIKGYEVLGELGRGGMGVVYRARQIQLNRPCVLKMILAGVHADDVATRRFLAEAEAVVGEAEARDGLHGGDVETSAMLAAHPGKVRRNRAEDYGSAHLDWRGHHPLLGLGTAPARPGWLMGDLNPKGAIGNAAAATPAKGEVLLANAARNLAHVLTDFARFGTAHQPG